MDIYKYVDEEIESLKQSIAAEFQNSHNLLAFDEINLANAKKVATSLYSRLKSRNRQAFRHIAKRAYKEAMSEAEVLYDGEEDIDGIIAALLLAFNPVTQYVYDNEVVRKRDRFFESIISAPNRIALRDAYQRASRLWFNQAQQYTDLSFDEARTEAFKHAGVKRVMWVTEEDDRVCGGCDKRNGVIYGIDSVPEKPHMRCRCYLTAVKD